MAWTVTQLVAEVQKRTENRAANKMDLRMEFFLALDQVCNKQHFWWRKRRGSFTTVVGTSDYDISEANPDFVELEEAVLMNADGVTIEKELTHITDPGRQLAMLLNNVQDTPSCVFVDTETSYQNINLQAPANVAQLIYFWYWAMPMVTDIAGQDTIPLLPPWLHYGMISALERRVYLVLFGAEDPRYETTNAEYAEFLEDANNTPSWSSKKVTEARTDRRYARIVSAHGPGSSGRVIPQG